MTCRIGEDAESLAASVQSNGSHLQHLVGGHVQIIDSDVEMHLLRRVAGRPARRTQSWRPLKRNARSIGRIADDHEVRSVLYPDHAEKFLVERR